MLNTLTGTGVTLTEPHFNRASLLSSTRTILYVFHVDGVARHVWVDARCSSGSASLNCARLLIRRRKRGVRHCIAVVVAVKFTGLVKLHHWRCVTLVLSR